MLGSVLQENQQLQSLCPPVCLLLRNPRIVSAYILVYRTLLECMILQQKTHHPGAFGYSSISNSAKDFWSHSIECTTGTCNARSLSKSSEPRCTASGA